MNLLAKTRKLNTMLQQEASTHVDFKVMAARLSDVMESNTFIVSRRGKLLGIAIKQQIEKDRVSGFLEERQFPEDYTKKLFNVTETTANIAIDSEHTAFPVDNRDTFETS